MMLDPSNNPLTLLQKKKLRSNSMSVQMTRCWVTAILWWVGGAGAEEELCMVVLVCVISWPRKDDSPDVLLSDALVVRLRIESDAGSWTDWLGILLRRISINFPHVHYCLKATKSEIKPLESSCSMATLSYIGILFSHSTLVPTGVNKSKQNLLEKTIKKSSITYLIPNKRPSSLYFDTMG